MHSLPRSPSKTTIVGEKFVEPTNYVSKISAWSRMNPRCRPPLTQTGEAQCSTASTYAPAPSGRGSYAPYCIAVDEANVLCARKPSGVVTTNKVLVAVAGPTYVATSAAEVFGKIPLYCTSFPGPSLMNSGPSKSTNDPSAFIVRMVTGMPRTESPFGVVYVT